MDKKPSGRRIARQAWGSLFAAVWRMPLIFLIGMGLLAALEIGGGFASSFLPDTIARNLFAMMYAFAQLVILAGVAVPVHRFILLGESGMHLYPALVLRSAAWLVPFYLLWMVLPMAGISSGDPVTSLMTMLNWASWIAFVWILLLFPAVAVGEESDERKRVETAIRRARGNFWLFLRSLLITLAPAFLALPVILLVMNFMQAPLDAGPITAGTLWLVQAGGWAFLVLISALGAAVASRLYSHLTESHLINEF
jgi:hypothetical protein